MQIIGTVVWWSIGVATVTDAELRAAVEQYLPGTAPPAAVLPVDAFRRLTGPSGAQAEYVLVGQLDKPVQEAELSLLKAKSQKTMLVRALVRTVREDGVNKNVTKVGDVVFYKPPRNEHHRARLRVTLQADGLPDEDLIKGFAEELRREYDTALSTMDAQAVRRLVRAYLSNVHALPLGGPYFVPDEGSAKRLVEFLQHIGGNKTITLPVVDVPEARLLIMDALDDANRRGEVTEELADLYTPIIDVAGVLARKETT